MNNIALSENVVREELFMATSQQTKLIPAIVEKDFWICWMLGYLFGQSIIRRQAVFKGGTSLSKAYGLIRRMSEDIDIILDWRLLGYGLDEPWEERSNKKQRVFIDEIRARAASLLIDELLPQMQRDFDTIGLKGFTLDIDPGDPQTILFSYPQTFSDDALLQEIRIEAGALSAWTPAEETTVTSYIAQEFPDSFTDGDVKVLTVLPERTFWEKVTILHKEAFRDTGRIPSRYSRHYYDIFEMAKSDIKTRALNDLDLLGRVVAFNQRFYRSAFAHYELARPGTMKLIPSGNSRAALEADYAAMRPMIYGGLSIVWRNHGIA